MLRKVFSAFVILFGLSAPALSAAYDDALHLLYYDDGGTYAVWEKHQGGALYVIGSYDSRNGCARFVDQRIGTPDGAAGHGQTLTGVVQITFTIEPGSGRCGGPATIRKRIATSGAITDDVVEIFYVSTSGRVLKHEKTAIRG